MQLSTRRFKLYNAGDRIQQSFIFSNPNGHDPHCICRFPFDAPSDKIFTLPEMIDLGGAQVHVRFVDDILRDFGNRGVILIDANWEPPILYEDGNPTEKIDTEADAQLPYARTEAEARAKGLILWKAFVELRVREYLDQCERIRSIGGVPLVATGAVKRYLGIAGISDPAEAMLIEAKRQTSVVEKLQTTIEAQQAQIDQLLRRDQQRENERNNQTRAPEPVGAKGKG